jgi:hypothetical protein
MTVADFAIWLRGLTHVPLYDAPTTGQMVLAKAREVLGLMPAKAEPVGLKSLSVSGLFCIHNVNVREQCPSCANHARPDWRLFALRLPVGTSEVYIRTHDRPTGNQDDAPAIPLEERAASAGGEVASGIPGRG